MVSTIKRAWVTAAALAGVGVYAARKELITKWLDLPPARYDVGVERGLMVPMEDGVLLATDHYFPEALGAFPTVLVRTPYGRGLEALPRGLLVTFMATRIAERGYHVVVQTTRGRYDSQGEFVPFADDERDGAATIAWIARQSWFTGELGMWGASYLGFAQWAAAGTDVANEHVKAMVPVITSSQPAAYYPGGAFILETSLRWVANITSADGTGRRSLPERIQQRVLNERRLARAFDHLPLIETDTVATGRPAEFYREWLRHPPSDDEYWEPRDYSDEIARTSASAHLVAGWYDFFLHAQLYDYQTLVAAGRRPYLTIGPWTHVDGGVLRTGLREGLAWFDAHLKRDRRRLRAKPVRLYVMGAGRGAWREYGRWPPPSTPVRYFLHAGGHLTSNMPPADSPPDRFTFDPADPTPALGGPVYGLHAGAYDNRVLEARDDVLVYTTPPLERAVEVIGPVTLELYVHTSRPRADVFGRLCDVFPDGRSINICDGLLRLTPKTGEPVSHDIRRVEVDLWATAYRFERGHRIRLQVSGGAHPRYNRNLGTDEPIATGTRMVAVEQVVYHNAERPSAVNLPVVNSA